jgi:hypothetical protein
VKVLILLDITLKYAYPVCLRIQGLLSVMQVRAAATNWFPAQKNSTEFVYIILCDLETSNRGGLSRIWAAQQHQKKHSPNSVIATLSTESR